MKHVSMKNWLAWGLGIVALTGCHWDLWDQDKYEPLEQGDFWGEGETSSRTLVAGTVPFGADAAKLDTAYFAGQDANGDFITDLPARVELTRDFLERGQARYQIYCSPCHGDQGLGNGMITKRGFPAPPSYTDQRLLESPIGYYFDVMTNGFGRMYSYASRIPVEDRWAIAAYVRVLQLSQNATPENIGDDALEAIEADYQEALAKAAAEAAAAHGGHGAAHGDHDESDAEGHEDGHGEHEEDDHGEH